MVLIYPGLQKFDVNLLRFDKDGKFEYILSEYKYCEEELKIVDRVARYVWIVYQEQKNKQLLNVVD